MRLTLAHRDQDWLYSVYCSDDQSEYVLAAIFAGVGWDEVSIRLTAEEARLFKSDRTKFLDFVNQVVRNRNSDEIKPRRIRLTQVSLSEIDI